MADPWVITSVQDAPKDAPAADPWAVSSVTDAPKEPTASDILDGPAGVPDTGWRGQVEKFGQGAAQAVTAPFRDPVGTAKGILKSTPAGMAYDAVTGQPNVGQQIGANAVQNPANALGQVAGGIALSHVVPAAVGAVGAAGDTVSGAASNFGNRWRPKPSPEIVSPTEQAARNLTNAINPETKRAPAYIKAAQVEVPNILDYAKRTNNPLNTQIEFAKAAEGNAQESSAHYNDNILGPNSGERAAVPANSTVRKYQPSGENPPPPTATLADINKQIIDLNKELHKPALNAADQRTALAAKADLQADHDSLVGILHRSLSNLTGVPPEEIADLRQRVGRSRELANDTNAAVISRGLQESAPGGQRSFGLPHNLSGAVIKGANELRGGPTAIGDRAFQKAIQNYPGEAKPLPKLGSPPAAAAPPKPVDSFDRIANAEATAKRNQLPAQPGAQAIRPLDKSTAQEYYLRAGKDPVKAREMARKDGYSF